MRLLLLAVLLAGCDPDKVDPTDICKKDGPCDWIKAPPGGHIQESAAPPVRQVQDAGVDTDGWDPS